MHKILVSACLYGWNCRYDALSIPCQNPLFLKWKKEGRLIPVCPEVAGGLPTPRTDAQRQGNYVLTRAGIDVTNEYERGAIKALHLARKNHVLFAIMKEKSPSCGSHLIYDGTFTGTKIQGLGKAAQLLKEAHFSIFNEEQIDEANQFLKKMEDS
ncbi:MAG TPA: DUF523 domain-containing protein [Ruminococcaceae bacterium]|nr:DUF523 domain-containing protein [Oscillospiraceae bacterium]